MIWLDNYIYGKQLTPDELRYMFSYPLQLFAYRIAYINDYESIKGRLALLQRVFHKSAYYKEVSYILDHTSLTKWQKFWLKVQYKYL